MIRRIRFPARPRNVGWGAEGDLWYQGPGGLWVSLPIPADWAAQEAAGTPYVLGISSGHPAWRASSNITLLGFGTRFGTSFGRD